MRFTHTQRRTSSSFCSINSPYKWVCPTKWARNISHQKRVYSDIDFVCCVLCSDESESSQVDYYYSGANPQSEKQETYINEMFTLKFLYTFFIFLVKESRELVKHEINEKKRVTEWNIIIIHHQQKNYKEISIFFFDFFFISIIITIISKFYFWNFSSKKKFGVDFFISLMFTSFKRNEIWVCHNENGCYFEG